MEPEIIFGIEFCFYRVACLLVGLAFCFMGYRLFLAEIEKGSPEPKHNGGTESKHSKHERLFTIAKTLPGTLFSMIGAVIVLFAVFNSTSTMIGLSEVAMKRAPKAELPDKLPQH
jgi:hypothetical protein